MLSPDSPTARPAAAGFHSGLEIVRDPAVPDLILTEDALPDPQVAGEARGPRERSRLKSFLQTLLVCCLPVLLLAAPLAVNLAAVAVQSTTPTEEHETNQSCETAQHGKLFESRRRASFRMTVRSRRSAANAGLRKYDRPTGTIGHRLSNGLLAPLTC